MYIESALRPKRWPSLHKIDRFVRCSVGFRRLIPTHVYRECRISELTKAVLSNDYRSFLQIRDSFASCSAAEFEAAASWATLSYVVPVQVPFPLVVTDEECRRRGLL